MIPFDYVDANAVADAADVDHDRVMAIAGGTTMVDLMKLNVLTPDRVVHVRGALSDAIEVRDDGLRIGAACTMAQLADHETVRTDMPAVRQSLILAATPQIRNMATLGGNVLQRTRSTYFRHVDMSVEGPDVDRKHGGADVDRKHGGADTSQLAVLGTGGRAVAMYPGDFAVTLVAFDGAIEIDGPGGSRTVRARQFFRLPGEGEFQYSTLLEPGELITHIRLSKTASLARSYYLKIRERSSYAFALVSVAAGFTLDGQTIRDPHIGLGGLASVPWHAAAAEDALRDRPATDEVFGDAARAAVADASHRDDDHSADDKPGRDQPGDEPDYRVTLARRAIVRALRTLRDRGVLSDPQLFATQHGRGIA